MRDTKFIAVSNDPSEKEMPASIDRYYPFEYWGYAISTIPYTTVEETADKNIICHLEQSGQFNFWNSSEEDIYTVDDGEGLT